MGSNGLTSARHDVFENNIAKKYPESYDPLVPSSLVYSGSHALTDPFAIDGYSLDIGRLVLSPTRTYAPVMKKVLDTLRPEIHGLIHCSGGAQTKVLNFVDNLHIIKDRLFSTPPLFKMIQKESKTQWQEMYKVFNMGHRMEVYLQETHAQTVIDIAREFGVDAQIIGYTEPSSTGKKVTIKSEHGEFTYS